MSLAIALPLIREDGMICTVLIPHMTPAMFTFFMEQLEVYKSAIIIRPEVVDEGSYQ